MSAACEREHRVDLGSQEDVAWALLRELTDLPVILRLEFDGEPVSKSRARFTGRGSKTRAFTPEKTRAAEERVVLLARQAGYRAAPDATSTFGIFAKFFCATWQRRDVDNMLKLVADALTGVVWKDDSQVVEMSAAVQRGVADPRTHVLVYKTGRDGPPTEPCKTCGKPVRQYPSQLNDYCSRTCSGLSQRTMVDKTCAHCGDGFRVRVDVADNRHHCRQACRTAARPAVALLCPGCGETFDCPPSLAKRRKTCSEACAATVARTRRTANAKGICSDCGGPTSKKTYARCRSCAYLKEAS